MTSDSTNVSFQKINDAYFALVADANFFDPMDLAVFVGRLELACKNFKLDLIEKRSQSSRS